MSSGVDESKVAHTTMLEDVASNQPDHATAHGVELEQIQDGYWKSPRFIGSCIAIIFQANSLFFGYAVPASLFRLSLVKA